MHNSKNVFIAIYINLLFTSLLGGRQKQVCPPKFQLRGGGGIAPGNKALMLFSKIMRLISSAYVSRRHTVNSNSKLGRLEQNL